MTDRNRDLVAGRQSLVRERALSRNGTKLAFTFSFRKRHKTEVQTYKKSMEWKENRLATLFLNVFSNQNIVQR